ncbi:hypothetical protein W97_06974 [Coniosporium apollinis CBS 100218]|uniref:Major facilitator superfamily (MFS) profile domain-containing protein n=1 Tax=Coniosporium apollinis (strain CBS 100218) TaxID=1168221 RepID=R7Z142_CONA1|nr:uncharacterized protein W97_06974 [Coniosporium apollinis CBS 100218]EON67606.1 hypothetical protein W97_06974 [Coniosporium apollinis CBS 100218]
MEKTDTLASDISANNDEIIGFEADEATLPKGYFTSRFFLGSMLATGLGLMCGVGAFGYAAAILTQINNDLGPDPRFTWVSLVYNACLAVCLAPVGRLSDIFGRRWFFIGGGVISVAGSIVCATATSIPMLIGGNVLLGIATATQLSFHFVMGELVPMKYRYMGNAFLYIFCIPGSGMGPVIATAFVTYYPRVGWRGPYWLLLAVNSLALLCWVLFYYPPTFHEKHKRDIDSKMYWVKNFDYLGTLLFAGGFVSFLLGLSFGGSIYPWKSASTIAPIVVGIIVLVIFVLYEIYVPKEPLIPMHLFKSMRWTAAVVLLGLGAGVYYAFAIIWPLQVAVLYGGGNLMYVGAVSVIVGMGIISGQVLCGVLAKKIGKTRYQCMVVFAIGGLFLACAATCTPDNKNVQIALIYIGCFFIGWNETICLANATILVHDQREIGVAGGVAGSVRSGICAILTTVYVSILTNRLTETVSTQVPPAIVSAGLPATSVVDFLSAFTVGTAEAFAAVPGVTAEIIAIGTRAYQEANADAYSTVYLSTIAFTGIALILTFFAPNTDELMSGKIVATLNHEGQVSQEKIAEEGRI